MMMNGRMNKTESIMNKHFILLSAAAVLLFSCIRESDQEVIRPGETITFTASWAGSDDTRTILQPDGTSVWWESGAQVNVFFSDKASGKFTSTNSQAQAIVDFQGSLPIVVGSVETENPPHAYWAVYPYNAANTCDGESVTLTVPATQTAKDGTFADKMFPSIATSTNFYLAFYNICGGVRFSVANEGIASVTFKANNGESLAGKVQVGFEGAPVVKSVVEGTSEVVVNAPEGGFIPGKYYFAALLPQTLSKGVSLEFKKSDGKVASTSLDNSISINRSRFGMVDEKDKGLEFKNDGGGDNPANAIAFADEKVKEKLVAAFDTNGDGELSYEEAAAVTSGDDLKNAFGAIKTYKSFDEFQYFTGISYIPNSLFENWNLLSAVSLPSSSYIIGTYSFKGCLKLESLLIPDSVVSIGGGAFMDCSALRDIILPSNIKSIGAQTFSGCSSLQEIMIPNGVSQIGTNAFYECTSLSGISLPKTVTAIGEKAFYGCTNLSSIVILGELSSIEAYTFYGCKNLQSIVIPDSVTNIKEYAFTNCSELSSLHIPSRVTSIGQWAFQYCTGLASISIEYGLSAIERYAFEGCSSLESIYIPDSVISVGFGAFRSCSNLASITIPESMSIIEGQTFRDCSSLGSIVIPESISTIDGAAFDNCTSLKAITIPASVATINGNVFSGCSGLESIIVDSENSVYDSRNNCNSVIETATGLLLTGCKNTVIPDGVTQIYHSAFRSCTGLTSICIPDSVISIGAQAFDQCSNLTSVRIPDSVTSLETFLFRGCSSLSSVVVGNNVSLIKEGAFMNCSSLMSITLLPSTPPTVSWSTYNPFQGCPYALVYYVPSQSLEAYKSAKFWKDRASHIQAIQE